MQAESSKFFMFFPLLLILLILANYFEVLSKVMKSLGLTEYAYEDLYKDEEKKDMGEDLLARERKIKEK